MSAPFEPGERVLLVDSRGRRFLIRLLPGGTFHFHGGALAHDVILGREEGAVLHSHTGAKLACYRPTMADVILKMPRGARVFNRKTMPPTLGSAATGPGARCL